MAESIFIGLIQNIAVLLSFTLVYEYLWNKNEEIQKNSQKIISGVIIGLIGIFLMYIPWTLSEGVVFDMRSVLLSISGLFFGAIPTLIAMFMTAVYRVIMGGSGTNMGIAVVLSAGSIGLLWRHFFPPRKIRKPFWNLLLLGFLVHVAMLLCAIFLPKEVFIETLLAIALPLLLIYTPGTMLLGLLMLKRWSIWQVRKEKEENEKKYRDLVENAGEAIAVTQEGYMRFANRRVAEILQYDIEEILSKPFDDFVYSDDKKLVLDNYKKHIHGEKVPERSSFRVVDKLGAIKWIELIAVLIDWEGKPALLNFFSDMSAYRETQRQLQIAKEKAEESDRLKSIFLANMSHEIRTPMNAIIGFSDLLANRELPAEKYSEYLNMIHYSGERLLKIINDIIDLSKLEAGSIKLELSSVPICEFLEKNIKTFESQKTFLHKKQLSLRLNCSEKFKGLYVRTDPFRLQQILENLLGNAVKFTEKGFVELGYDIRDLNGKTGLYIYVRDTGPGIDPEKQSLIFERFRQIEENDYHEGAGLGLSISRGLAALFGAKIELESEPGKGSCFSLTIPVETGKKGELPRRKETMKIPDLSDYTILIAEDDNGSVYLLEELLRPCEVKPAVVGDGKALMDHLEVQVPDLILLDINLPGKDGISCLREIRKKGYQSKVIIQTAYAMPDERNRYLKEGCSGYLAKPLDPASFYAEIEHVLKNGGKET